MFEIIIWRIESINNERRQILHSYNGGAEEELDFGLNLQRRSQSSF